MAYTKEEIARERERRNRLKSGISSPEPMEDEESISGHISKYGKPLAAGLAQGAVNSGVSVLNLLLGSRYGKNSPIEQLTGIKPEIPHLKLEKYLPEDHSKGALLAGELLAPLGIVGKGASLVNKAPTMFKGIPGFAEKIGKNAGLGYALGEQENEEGEHYGRGLAAALSGAIPAFAATTKKAVGKNVVERFGKIKSELKQEYNKLFETAHEKGVEAVKNVLTKDDIYSWVKDIPKDFRRSTQRYFDNPTLKNAHKAQSDLGKYAAELKYAKEIQGTLPDELNRRIEKLDEARQKMREEIQNALFDNKATSGLGWKYMDLSGRWKEKLGPYLDVPDISKAASGHLDPAELTNVLQGKGAYKFRQEMGLEHPEIEINDLLNKYLWKKSTGLGLAGAGFGAYHLLNKMDRGK